MRRRELVRVGRRLVPRGVVEADPMYWKPGACLECGGTGVTVEVIDDDRHPVLVTCPGCAGSGKKTVRE